jgi:hypothetical protein
MQSQAASTIYSYVKVEVRTHSPKLWGWAIRRTATDNIVAQSDMLFRYSEDAWTDGQRRLSEIDCEQVLRQLELSQAA